MRRSHYRVAGRFTPATSATVTIEHDPVRLVGLVHVRPLRCRRAYVLDLATVAGLVVLKIARLEAAARPRRSRRR